MYTLIKAVVIGRSTGSQWKEMDLSQIFVYDIFNTYREIYLVLSSFFLSVPIYVNMDTLRREYSSYTKTLSELISELGNRTLETVDELPNTKVVHCKYSDAIRAGYKVNITRIGEVVPPGYPADDIHDLVITRPKYDTDLAMIHNYCLVTVNGFIHNTDTDGMKAFVYNGADTMRKSRVNHLGILSFLDVGKVTKVKLQDSNIYNPDGRPLKERIYLNIPEAGPGKTVLLSLGGYLVFQEADTFWQLSDTRYALDITRLPMVERYFESNEFIDLSGLELSVSSDNEDLVNVEQFFTDATIHKYFGLSQTFAIVIDTEYLFTEKSVIRNSNLPGMFTVYEDPVDPLFVGYGRMAEYWKVEEDGFWAVNVQDNYYRNYVFTYTADRRRVNVTPNAVPGMTFFHSKAALVQIGAYK